MTDIVIYGALPSGPEPVVADYYVATSGSDTTGDGSSGNPWATIRKAALTMPAQKTVSIAAGTYSEQRIVIGTRCNGSSTTRTKFVANGTVIVTNGFELQANYVELDGFEVTPGAPAGSGTGQCPDVIYRGQVYVTGNNNYVHDLNVHDISYASGLCFGGTASNNLVEDCTFTKPAHAGISTGGSGATTTGNTVRRCTITKFAGDRGLDCRGSVGMTVENTTITGPLSPTDFQQPYPSICANGDGVDANYTTNLTLKNCNIYDIWCYTGAAGGEHADCIQFFTHTTGLMIDGCILGTWKMGGPPDYALGPLNSMMVGTVSDGSAITFTVQNCVFLDGIDQNTHLGNFYVTSGSVTATIVNNTFFGNYPALVGSANVSLVSRNNVYYSHRGSYTTGSNSNYNAFCWQQWRDASVSGGSLQASTVYSGEGANSLGRTSGTALNPLTIFTNPDVTVTTGYGLTADFSPAVGSPLIGAGQYSASYPQYDILGNPRSNPPSIGAYE